MIASSTIQISNAISATNEAVSNHTKDSLEFIPGQIRKSTSNIAQTLTGLVTDSANEVMATTMSYSDSTLRQVDLESERIRNVIMNMKF